MITECSYIIKQLEELIKEKEPYEEFYSLNTISKLTNEILILKNTINMLNTLSDLHDSYQQLLIDELNSKPNFSKNKFLDIKKGE